MEELFEKAVKLQEKTGASLEACKAALESSGGDMLDAAILLERLGSAEKKTAFYSTSEEQSSSGDVGGEIVTRAPEPRKDRSQFRKNCSQFGEQVKKLINASVKNMFVISRTDNVSGSENEMLRIPVLALILLFIFAFWMTLPLLIVGLFFGCHYQFEGVGSFTVDVNKACEKASEAAENMKDHM